VGIANLTVIIHPSLNATAIDQNFIPNTSEVFDQVNFSDNFTMQSVNYSWNISVFNGSTNATFLYNFTNNYTRNLTIQFRLNQSPGSIVTILAFENRSQRLTLNTDYQDLIIIGVGQSILVNMTLDLIGLAKTFVNWTLTSDNTNFKFNETFRIIQ